MRVGEPYVPWGMFAGAYIPLGLAAYTGISASAKLIWAMLNHHAGDAGVTWASQADVAEECGLSRRTVNAGLAELKSERFIYVVGKKNRRVVWGFLWHESLEGCVRNVHSSKRGSVQNLPTTPEPEPEAAQEGAKCAESSHDSVQNLPTIMRNNCTLPSLLERTNLKSKGEDHPSLPSVVEGTCEPPPNARAPDDDRTPRRLFTDLWAGSGTAPDFADYEQLDDYVEQHGPARVLKYLREAENRPTCRRGRVMKFLRTCFANEVNGNGRKHTGNRNRYGL